MSRVSVESAQEICAFAEEIKSKYNSNIAGESSLYLLTSNSDTFKFLENEEELYNLEDIKPI
jgi:hypothetical protein